MVHGHTHYVLRGDRYLALSPMGRMGTSSIRGWNKFHQIDKIAYRVLPRAGICTVSKVYSAIFARLDISKRMLDSKKMNVKD